jgi:hypothetical protein
MIPPSSLVISQGWGLIDLPLRASNEGLLRPRVARAQETISLLIQSDPPFLGEQSNCPLLRASNEHSLIVRVPRARRTVWLLPHRTTFLDCRGRAVLASLLFHKVAYFQVNHCGAVAQLGARVNGIHEVAGSIPASSTKIIT